MAESADKRDVDAARLRVLVVDDDPDSVAEVTVLLQQMQTDLSVVCESVESVSDALKRIRDVHFDIIMLDIGVADLPSPQAITELRGAFSYAPIIAMSKYADDSLALEWVRGGADDCLYMGVMTSQIFSRIVNYAILRSHTYRALHQRSRTHHVLNALLRLSQKALPLEPMLEQALQIILSAPFAEIQHRGGIFLADESARQLRLVAQDQLNPKIQSLCQEVEYGHCLCGMAAEQRKLLFASCVDERHTIGFDGMQPHGHYNVPIMSKQRLLGVIVLYLDHGHRRSKEEEEFLNGVADTLAGIIERIRTQQQLVQAHEQNSRLLASINSILIGVDNHDQITHWNQAAEAAFGLSAQESVGLPIVKSRIPWDWAEVTRNILICQSDHKQTRRFDVRYQTPRGGNRLLSVSATPFIDAAGAQAGYLLIADDVTEQKQLDSEVQQVQKLQSIGQLAAGIAHEINTPIQYVGDNVRFLQDSFNDLAEVISDSRKLLDEAGKGKVEPVSVAQLEERIEEVDLDYLHEEIPAAISQSLEGIDRVAKIVRAMKEFSHPGAEEKSLTDINKAIESTAIVTRNVWKYHAELEMDLDPGMPEVLCFPGPFNEVILNIIVNAAHAITEKLGESSTEKGVIRITSRAEGDWAVVRISDSGTGIPEAAQAHVFEPFFTTKEVGHGTGQGLSLSHRIIVDNHAGELNFETRAGEGTTFIVRLPLSSDAS
ncbi:ATP-binding protein [Candidatus Endoriftia persephone]|jgi:PAS domain S-box-containing protein|uniref:histidine kinase n=2 Tax=Gammaproteobacteria TaxID=1236 RepID=G2DGN6_9GAMM|nr:ATP-binding protein [Candidatus Endoriftia persephone]EGV50226.1 signal transduction histidine-protein kinase AtoS [endosymbiont of Riftia pachyptila (vent Ph05)]USF88264.1 ATP-binding protein [Candidatus Endoriftia persephone]